ncbi:MAG: hypothetical protein C5B51_06500 [Terriglobia bacterium]|nr:MAG: hypothetical protein C5B51_06500 [Terriglobia bacterium]
MERDFRQGYLEIDFPVASFDSAWELLRRSAAVFFSNFRFLAVVTLLIFVPAKLALQFIAYLLEVPKGGLTAYLMMDLSDLVLSSFAVPAAIYGLVHRFRTDTQPPLGPSLRWGRRQWLKTLWNKFKVEITITLWGALLIVPGVIAMIKLILTDAIVAIEADREWDVLQRSRDLTAGRRWQIFLVLLPVMIVELAGTFLVLDALGVTTSPRPFIALVDSLLSAGGQWSTVVVLLLYLGIVPVEEGAEKKRKRAR